MTDDAAPMPPTGAEGRPGLRGHLLVLLLLACLYVPLAGNYTLFDPWETHHAEVARTAVVSSTEVVLG